MANTVLSHAAFCRAQNFLETQARPLELAQFRFHFRAASAGPVLAALASHQNEDGGFGHGLEPDFRAPESSALCTSIAFQILRSLQVPPETKLLTRGLDYLVQTVDRDNAHWPIIPRSATPSPHAPWWDRKGSENEPEAFSLNPTAEILGYLYNYADRIPDDLIPLISQRVLDEISGLESIEMHDLLCCLRLLRTKALPADLKDTLVQKLSQLIDGAVNWQPDAWSGYSLRPLQVIDSPDSTLIRDREEAVVANLAYEIAEQNQEGAWTPTWDWGDTFPEAWEVARREWSGVLTLDRLLLLQRFQRIDRYQRSCTVPNQAGN